MKLLIVTQKVDKNDDVLGFFHDWIREFSKNVEKLTVICLQKGEYDLPGNVKVLSLGKENFKHSTYSFRLFQKINYFFIFWKHIWSERKNYDAVFVHMNVEYVIIAGLFWKIFRKKIGLWYAHGSINLSLRIAALLSDVIFSSSKSGFRLDSPKLVITGQGIDTGLFSPVAYQSGEVLRIITVGRISPVKHCEEMIEVARLLEAEKIKFTMSFAGQPITEVDKKYFELLKNKVSEYGLSGSVSFIGSVPFHKISEQYKNQDIFLNLSDTGSLDKAVLEAMASGLIVLTSNEAYKDILPGRYFLTHDPGEISEAIISAMKSDKISLRDYVIENHSQSALIKKILKNY